MGTKVHMYHVVCLITRACALIITFCSNHCSFAHPASYFLHSLTLFTFGASFWHKCFFFSLHALLYILVCTFLTFKAQSPIFIFAAAISCCSSCRRFSSTERPRCLPAFTASAGEASCRTAVAPCASAADASDSAAAITHKRQSLAGYEPVAPVAAKDIDARSASFDA